WWSPNHAPTSRANSVAGSPSVASDPCIEDRSIVGSTSMLISFLFRVGECGGADTSDRSAAREDACGDEQDQHEDDQRERTGPRAREGRAALQPDQLPDEERQALLRRVE